MRIVKWFRGFDKYVKNAKCLIIKTTIVVFTGERLKVFNNKNDYGGVHR